MEIHIGLLNIYEACSFPDTNHPYIPDYYHTLIADKNFDILFLVECPMDNKDGRSAFVSELSQKAELPYIKLHASDTSFIGPAPYSGIAILSKVELSRYRVVPYDNPNLVIEGKDGNLWHSHDKFMQLAEIELANRKNFTNQYPRTPTHHFRI